MREPSSPRTTLDLDDRNDEWFDGNDPERLPVEVRDAFPVLAGSLRIRPLSGGLLHRSIHVRTSDADFVLQRVSDVFAPEIHENIESVTRHLAQHGFPVASLVSTGEGALSADLGSTGRWRLMPHLGGASFQRLQSVEQARSAGRLVGRFHSALEDFDRPLAPLGIPYRDTPRYLDALRQALAKHRDHRLHPEMNTLGERVLAAFDELGSAPDMGARVIHGDLKLANLLFESDQPPGRDRAFALIDLDTLMWGTLWMELGDAWRSWCNPAGEDTKNIEFDLVYFEASWQGFVEGCGGHIESAERTSLAVAPERMALELCARFVTDALEECYFGWDEARFESRGDHNALRAVGQMNLYEAARRTEAERIAILDGGS